MDKSLDREIHTEFDKELFDQGFMVFIDYLHGAYRLFEKKVKDDKGIKYFVHCYHWKSEALVSDAYSIQLQFINKDNDIMNIGLSSDKNLDEIMEYVEELWNKLNIEYYEEY